MTTRKRASVPAHISRLVRNLRAAGGEIHRDGGDLLVNGPPTAAAFIAALRANVTELAAYVVPRVTPEEAATVRMLLSDAGVRIAYITEPAAPEFWGEVQPPASLKGLDIPSRRADFVPWKPSRRRGFGMGNPTFR
jgi:hypothetical protein